MCMHPRRLFVAFAMACTLAGCGGHSDDVPLVASAILSGREQVPSNISTALSSGTVTGDHGQRTLIVSVFTDMLTGTEVHLHNAPPGVAGLVVVALTRVGSGNLWQGSVTLTEGQWDAFRQGNFYFDVHSAAYAGGELRGQLFDAFPPDEHVAALQQAASQSALLAEQLRQLDDYEDWWYGGHSGIGIGLSFGF